MQILTTAVISILMTAPIGAILIGVTGPRFLRRVAPVKQNEDKDQTEMNAPVAPEGVEDTTNNALQVNTTV